MNLGWLEVGLILLAAVLVFGPKKIPELGSAFGKTLRGFKEELDKDSEDEGLDDDSGGPSDRSA